MSIATIRIRLGDPGQRTHDPRRAAIQIGLDACDHPGNASIPVLWDHDHRIGTTRTLAMHDRRPIWTADIDLGALAQHTDQPLHRLGASPLVTRDERRLNRLSGAYILGHGSKVYELSLTDQPALPRTSVELLAERPGTLFASTPPGTTTGSPATRHTLAHYRHDLGHDQQLRPSECSRCTPADKSAYTAAGAARLRQMVNAHAPAGY